ncbi:putative membrane protein [[Clostridium] bifermentans ATCC 638]|uniref:Putative membrane protein n=1 Tax=Paraclostridium bifermentans ATCC 638 = DSM 14991 TaxID=1233171 RepID=T4VE66_PARBF|nr:hypothetical protein [Paraclostridium bifermentans]EQK39788.1 putative membrane protein [[Clostridium] bifermentans ATCC 638] [Paraclostridium bifermentans ATCC 638 = DSM 14991]
MKSSIDIKTRKKTNWMSIVTDLMGVAIIFSLFGTRDVKSLLILILALGLIFIDVEIEFK